MSRLLTPAAALVLLLALTGCGDDRSEPDASDTTSSNEPEPIGLSVTRADGTLATLGPITAECVPSEYQPDVQILHLSADTDEAHFSVQVVPTDVEAGKTFPLPIDNGDQETGPANVLVFAGLTADVETSSSEEESSGTLEVLRVSCDPVELELTINATLGSEYSDGEELDVKGRIVFPTPTS